MEIAPVGGYRFGGGFFEQVTQQQVDLDGAPAVGAVVGVALHDGLFVEALVSHQEASITVPQNPFGSQRRWQIDVDHYQAGGLQEFFDRRRTRPFLTGLLGLTRYAADGDNEFRFTASAGGGVKLMPVPRLGIRLDGRVFATFVEAEGRAIACSPGHLSRFHQRRHRLAGRIHCRRGCRVLSRRRVDGSNWRLHSVRRLPSRNHPHVGETDNDACRIFFQASQPGDHLATLERGEYSLRFGCRTSGLR